MEQIDIMDYIWKLARLAKRRPMGEHRLPRSAYRVLKTINCEGRVQLSELAEKLDIRPSSLSEIISKMTEHELVDKIKSEEDSRIIYVSVSDKGQAQLRHNEEVYTALKNKVNEALTAEEKRQFAAICEKLIVELDSAGKDEGEYK